MINKLVEEINSNIYNESLRPFPAFALKDDWVGCVWPDYYKTNPSLLDESGMYLFNPMVFERFRSAVVEYENNENCFISDVSYYVDDDGNYLRRINQKLHLCWDDVNNFTRFFDGFYPLSFYIFNENLNWIVFHDGFDGDFILIAGCVDFMDIFAERMGGYMSLIESVDAYTLDEIGDECKVWLSNIRNRLIGRMNSNY